VSTDLVAHLESPLPASLPVGAGTAVFCYGTCSRRRGVRLLVDGVAHRPAATGMPRPGAPGAFWGTVPIPARQRPGTVRLELAARIAGREVRGPLGEIAVVTPEPPPADPVPADLIAVCMATFDPDPELLRAQVESLRAQTDTHWRCYVSDDCSSPERFAALEAEVGGDERFVVSRSERRLGFYRNFERALRLAPGGARLLALCDQDDRWHPDKLATLRGALGAAHLVYSDQRLVDRDGRVLRDTMWRGRRNNHTDLATLLVANSVTGAAALFRREVAELALPFPDTPGLQFHDHWLGLVALAAGDVAYVDRPLYDYVQHRGAVFGEVSSGSGARRGGARGAYFLGYLSREVTAQALLVRCGHRLTPGKRRALERFVAADRSPRALAWLAVRGLTRRRETLGSELELLPGLGWRRLLTLLRRGDARFPDPLSFEQRRLRRWRGGA
jgi:glycosyltransferase involved in cell wall biosynthesis